MEFGVCSRKDAITLEFSTRWRILDFIQRFQSKFHRFGGLQSGPTNVVRCDHDNTENWFVLINDDYYVLDSIFDCERIVTRIHSIFVVDESLKETKCWEEQIFEGAWISGVTAGGCRNHLQTYAMNPQYLITLVDHDEGDNVDECTLIIALMQKNRRRQRRMGLDTLTIGFAVYAIHDNLVDTSEDLMMERGFVRRQLLNTEFFKYNKSVARSPSYINLREVITRVKLPPGRYCIIPSTFDPNEEGEFILRIFTEKPPKNCIENDDEVGIISRPLQPIAPDHPDHPNANKDGQPVRFSARNLLITLNVD